MKSIIVSLGLLFFFFSASGQMLTSKKGKRDTLYTITMSKLEIVNGKATDRFEVVNLKWADTLWHVSRDLDFTKNMAIENYRWFFYDKNYNMTRFERYIKEKLDLRIAYKIENNLCTERNFYNLSNGDTVLFRKDVLTRNAQGQVVKVVVVDGSGSKIASESYAYDSKGNEVKKKSSMKRLLDADSVYNRQTSYAYDSLGRIAKKTVSFVKSDRSKAQVVFVYSYNKDGKLESTIRYDRAGNMLGKEEVVYYSGRVSQRKYYNEEGVLTENLAFRYRKFGASVDNNMY